MASQWIIDFLVSSWSDDLPAPERRRLARFRVASREEAVDVHLDERLFRIARAEALRVHTPAWLRLAELGDPASAFEAIGTADGPIDEGALRGLGAAARAAVRAAIAIEQRSVQERLIEWPEYRDVQGCEGTPDAVEPVARRAIGAAGTAAVDWTAFELPVGTGTPSRALGDLCGEAATLAAFRAGRRAFESWLGTREDMPRPAAAAVLAGTVAALQRSTSELLHRMATMAEEAQRTAG